ncbi:hypothetical protein [Bacteriovorax sp. Seq25_V]|uniref:hypothetical protein n=1 Tax=Bacteriovorax sp. Seq25_V TaxID=1201288 RepID=UPI00038A466B|nr:hypothetical protein [Bacteriovorax sp. Seq25_V]EQC44233.1 outer membrane protein beta-barrel domain protein [Bacteriovorax sp. Seq25_V]
MKKGNKQISLLLSLMAISLPMGQSFAQEDPLLTETADQIVNTDQIDIEGLYSQKQKQPSQADRIQKLRRELEEKHEQMMRKKVEDMRLEEERKLARKLQNALNGQMQAMDQVSTQAAAPVKTVEAVAPAPQETLNNSVSLSGGFMSLSSDTQDLEAGLNLRLGVENRVHPNITVGVGVRYVSLDTKDQDNNYINYGSYGSNYYGIYSNNNSIYNEARTINFKQVSFDLNSKFYFTVDSKIRPFAGVAVAYNRGSFKYEENKSYYYNGNNYGDEKVSSNNVSGAVMVGAQIQFSKHFSAEISAQYERALNSGVSDLKNSNTPDEQRLRNLALDLEEANIASINAGLSVNF